MKRDDIIRMAREAGYTKEISEHDLILLTRFASLAAAAEREAWPNLECVVSWLDGGCDPHEAAKELRLHIAAMRARGQA